MSKYDGPSYFKKNHPKIKPLKNSKKDAKENKKVSWADQDNYFKDDYRDTIPNRVQTRTDIQEKALDYMQTPSNSFDNRQTEQNLKAEMRDKKANNLPREKANRFRSKHIPASLQNLEGWKTITQDHTMITEVKKRLTKETNTYLLFEDKLAPEVAEALKDEEQVKSSDLVETNQIFPINKRDQSISKASQKAQLKNKRQTKRAKNKRNKKLNFDERTQKRAERVQEELNHNLLKPNTGLHRSLSKIIAEDQEALESGKNNLGSLFSDED